MCVDVSKVESNETIYFDVSPAIQKIAVKEMNDLEKYCKEGRLVRCEFSPEWFLSRPLWHGTITYEGLSQIDTWI